MKRILLLCLLTLTPAIAPATALAAAGNRVVDDLYTGEAVVTGQADHERERALPLALAQVLGKLSGLPHFEDRPLVRPALERAQAILLSYHYRSVVRPGPGADGVSEQRLVARFSPAAVDELARALQLPVWRYNRPALVVWLVVDENGERRIMPVEYMDVVAAMTDVAAGRGLPVEWPEPVVETGIEVGADSGIETGAETEIEAGAGTETGVEAGAGSSGYAVDLQLLWGGYTEDLATPDGKGVMIVAARREGPQWGIRINLGYKGRHWAWRLQENDLHAALVTIMHQAVDQVAEANSIEAADLGSWDQDLSVAGLRRAEDYQRCLAYLQGLNIVESVSVVSARPGVVTFRLVLRALPRHLDESLAADGILSWVEADGRYLLAEVNPDER